MDFYYPRNDIVYLVAVFYNKMDYHVGVLNCVLSAVLNIIKYNSGTLIANLV